MKERIFPDDLVLEPISQFQFLPEIPGFPRACHILYIIIYIYIYIYIYTSGVLEHKWRASLIVRKHKAKYCYYVLA